VGYFLPLFQSAASWVGTLATTTAVELLFGGDSASRRLATFGKFHDQANDVEKWNYNLILTKSSKFTLRAADPRAANRPARGLLPAGRIIVTL
jgi:hypothetical protein